MKGKGWVPADELSVGNELEMKDGSLQKISAITLSNESTSVYNFTVTDFHTYYISDIGILIHNLQAACKIENYKNLSPKLLTDVKGTPSKVLTAEIEEATNMKKPDGWVSHHLVPYADARSQAAIDTRKILDDLNINRNSSGNGVFSPKEKGSSTTIIDGQTMATHNGGHAVSYYQFVLKRLEKVKDNEVKVLEELDFIREELLFGRLKIGNISN
ncbi:hypothetical protein J2T13_001400 [Paenibacillus sp. DS2015]|uniref:polymorphic toxin-type HINT domain-containing protein n=1 Tax=Paenibacillus sp. DS2015 TaxID=3373917 RepID=UPI003D1F8202